MFVRPRNITFDRQVFLILKQLRGETLEHFYGKLSKMVENRDFKNKEETLIRDVFLTNLIDPENQKQLLKETVETRKALELAIDMELGIGNQHQILAHNKTLVLANLNVIQYPKSTRSADWSTTNCISKQATRHPALHCQNCGSVWTPGQEGKSVARGKTCSNCN